MSPYEGLTHEEYISKFGCTIQMRLPHTLSDVAAEKATDERETVVDPKTRAKIGSRKRATSEPAQKPQT